LAKLLSTKLQEGEKDYLRQSYILTDSHRVQGEHTHPVPEADPTLSYGASGALWSAKHNKFQNWNFPNYTNKYNKLYKYV